MIVENFKVATKEGALKGVKEIKVEEVKDFDYNAHKDDWFQFNHVGVTYDCHIFKDKLTLSFPLNDAIVGNKVLELSELNPERPRV